MAKGDRVLAERIEEALQRGLPLDALSANKQVLPPHMRCVGGRQGGAGREGLWLVHICCFSVLLFVCVGGWVVVGWRGLVCTAVWGKQAEHRAQPSRWAELATGCTVRETRAALPPIPRSSSLHPRSYTRTLEPCRPKPETLRRKALERKAEKHSNKGTRGAKRQQLGSSSGSSSGGRSAAKGGSGGSAGGSSKFGRVGSSGGGSKLGRGSRPGGAKPRQRMAKFK